MNSFGQNTFVVHSMQFSDMANFEEEFTRNFHMNVDEFNVLYDRLKHRLEPKNTRVDTISGKQRLAFTLEYLAGGAAFERYSASVYRISRSSTSQILMETCQIIYEELAETEFPTFSREFWLHTATTYHAYWNMPHCLGSIDGKHVRIKKPANAGSAYYNYKVSATIAHVNCLPNSIHSVAYRSVLAPYYKHNN